MGLKERYEAWWENYDADVFFSYTTIRKVVLQDRYLGLLDKTLKIGILVYILVYVMWMEGGYLKVSAPSGTTRLSLLQPNYTTVFEDASKVEAMTNYCTNVPAAGSQPLVPGSRLTCLFVPSTLMTWPPTLGPYMLIGSRMSRTRFNGKNGCAFTDPFCSMDLNKTHFPPKEEDAWFFGGVEWSTLFIDHNIRSADGSLVKDLSEMQGKMVNCDEQQVGPQFKSLGPGEHVDWSTFIENRVVTVEQLYKAASGKKCSVDGKDENFDIKLDSRSGLDKKGDKGDTIRYDGAVLIVAVTYDNTKDFSVEDVQFTIKVRRLPGTEYKMDAVVQHDVEEFPTAGAWTQQNSHGTFVIVVQTGKIGEFDFITMLVQFTAALTLLAVSAKATDLLATHVLPRKEIYKHYMYLVSHDFSDGFPVAEEEPGEKTGLVANGIGIDTERGSIHRSLSQHHSLKQAVDSNSKEP